MNFVVQEEKIRINRYSMLKEMVEMFISSEEINNLSEKNVLKALCSLKRRGEVWTVNICPLVDRYKQELKEQILAMITYKALTLVIREGNVTFNQALQSVGLSKEDENKCFNVAYENLKTYLELTL